MEIYISHCGSEVGFCFERAGNLLFIVRLGCEIYANFDNAKPQDRLTYFPIFIIIIIIGDIAHAVNVPSSEVVKNMVT